MPLTDFKSFKGAAKRIEDLDLPRIAHRIGVGEDELHAFMDTETAGSGFDPQGRPKILFEPHVFYRNLSGAKRDQAVKAGLAYAKWGTKPYGKESTQYGKLVKAMAIDETAALKAASWGLAQVLGENHKFAGYATPQAMVKAFMEDEENHLDAAVTFIVNAKLDGELRKLAKLTRPTTPADTEPFVRGYNGPGYKKNNYHVKFAAAHNKWRKIKDTPWSPGGTVTVIETPAVVPVPPSRPAVQSEKEFIETVQILLRDKGYPEVGEPDGKYGNRTRNAILAFEADNNLPLTGQMSDELLANLIKAPVRVEAAARENATAKDLKEAPIVNMGGWLQKLGVGVVAVSGIGGLVDGTGTLDDAISGITKLRTVSESLLSFSPWIIGAVVGSGALLIGSRVVKKYVEAYREGRAL